MFFKGYNSERTLNNIMKNLIELYEFLDKSDTETLLVRLTELIDSINDQFGDESGLRILNYRNQIKNLYKLIDYHLEKGITGIEEKHASLNPKIITPEKAIVAAMSDSMGNNDHLNNIQAIDKYKSMDAGDIDFLCSILPYSKNYIRELCRNGDLPYEKPKGKYMFNRFKIEEWKKQHGSESKLAMVQIGKSSRSTIKRK
ncbi:MAG: helix-turn-helix domain-containing protein [Bacteroidales bacterium]|nr:helix-turn-helix domain-containing protein [Bacteroidales bacterium]